MIRRLLLPAVLAGALLLSFCQDPESGDGGALITVEADSALFGFDSVRVLLIDSSGRDTSLIFEGKLESAGQLRRILVRDPPQGEIRLLILGFAKADTRPVYEEERVWELGSDSLRSSSVPLDVGKGISRPPTLEFLAMDTSGRAGDTLSFQARAADPDGDLVAYAWYFDDADTAAAIRESVRSPSLEISARWSFARAGRRQAALEVRDNTGNRVRRQAEVAVLARGVPAVRFAFSDTLISIGDTLAFAAVVRDSDGVIAAYAWDLEGDGSFGQGLVLDAASDTVVATRHFPDTGLHRVVLRAVDDRRQEARDTARVRVVLDPPWADAGEDAQAVAEDSMTLNGRGGDGLGTVVRYAWKIGEADFAEAPGGTIAFRAPADSGVVTCVLRVTDDDGLAAEDTARVQVVLSGNAYLARLEPSAGTLAPGFAKALTAYALTVPYASGSLDLKLKAEHPRATLTVAGDVLPPGDSTARVSLEVGVNPIPILVLAPDGQSQRSYTLNVTRRRNSDAALAGLGVTAGKLEPDFSPDSLVYRLILQNSQDNLGLTPSVRDAAHGRIEVDGKPIISGTTTASTPIAVGSDTIFIVVLAQDETTARTYQLRVTRMPSTDASLKSLKLSNGALEPAFASEILDYRTTVAHQVKYMVFRPTVNHSSARIFFEAREVISGELADSLPLRPGENSIVLTVKAEDTSIVKTYQIAIHRERGFAKTFGGAGIDIGESVQQTRDGGFVVAGYTTSSGAGANDMYLLRTDGHGDALAGWPKIFGGTNDEEAQSVQQTDDGGFVVAGNMTRFSNGDRETYLLRTDEWGSVSSGFPKISDYAGYDVTYSIRQSEGGGFVMAGLTNSLGAGSYDVCLLRTDGQGNTLPGWPKTFGGTGSDEGYSVHLTNDGGFIIAGRTTSGGSGSYDVYLIRTDNNGVIMPGWPKTFGGANSDGGSAVLQTSDGGFIVVGTTASYGLGGNDVYLLRTDGQGNALPGWPKSFGGIGNDLGSCVQQTGDGGFIVVGSSTSFGSGGEDVFLLRTDGQGNTLPGWPKAIGGGGEDRGYSVQQTSDGGFILVGSTTSFGAGGSDVYLIKTDADGNVK